MGGETKAAEHPTWQELCETKRRLGIATGLLMGLLWEGGLSEHAHDQIEKFLGEEGSDA